MEIFKTSDIMIKLNFPTAGGGTVPLERWGASAHAGEPSGQESGDLTNEKESCGGLGI